MEIKTITVNKGDTLSQIAKENNTTVDNILKINKDITDPNLILVGQQINVEEMDFSEQINNIDDTDTKTDNVIVSESSNNHDGQVEIKNDDTTIKNISTGNAKPEDFDFRHEDSNILAAKARNMGFTDDQIKIAIGISRYETGNYKHLAYGYNYGGVTGNGDLGQQGGYAKYSSKDIGMDSYLKNLKSNYFDQGLNSVESIARKYLGYDDTSHWIKSVYGSMS